MGTIKKGASNRYAVTAAVASGDMQTALANLGNAVVFYSQVSTTGGTASTKSYSNSNQFPTLTALIVGMIVQIGWTADEVMVAVLGEANVASGGSSIPDTEQFTATAGQTVFKTTGRLFPGDDFFILRNAYPQGQKFDPTYAPTRNDDNTFTLKQAADAGDIITVPTVS